MKYEQILIIAYYFPPIKSMGVIRNFLLGNELSRQGHQVHIISTSNNKILPSENLDVDKSIKVESVFTFDYRTILNWFRKKESTHLSVSSKNNFIGKFFVKALRSFPLNLIVGEGGFFYCLNAIRSGSKIIQDREGMTLLYSSFPTYSDHLVAQILRSRFPNKTKWIADFRDLHTDPLYKIVYFEKFQHWCNQMMLKKADIVSTISEGLAEQLKKYHNNVHVFLNGVKIRKNEGRISNRKFTISYTGSLFSDERDPSMLFKALTSLKQKGLIEFDDLRFEYAGKDGQMMMEWVEKYKLISIYRDYGLVSRAAAFKLQDNADINLLLTSSHIQMSGILTGKLFEYLSTENPILLIINGRKDEEFESIFSSLNAGHICYNNSSLNEIEAYLLSCYKKWKLLGWVKNEIDYQVLQKSFSWESNVKKLLKRAS